MWGIGAMHTPRLKGCTILGIKRLWLVLLGAMLFSLSRPAYSQMLTGSYVGDGTDERAITGLGFQPDVVVIKGDTNQSAAVRTSTMVGDAAKPVPGSTALTANLIQSVDSGGFTIGSDNRVNASGINYYWIAFKQDSDLELGTYVGNSGSKPAERRSQDITGLGFEPDYVVVMSQAADTAYQRSSDMSGSFTFTLGLGEADKISAFLADGFRVGWSPEVNRNGTTYHYIAWNEVSGKTAVASYTGDGTDGRSIAVGFTPEYVIIRGDYYSSPYGSYNVHHPASLGATADSTLTFVSQPSLSNAIQALETNGFQVGTSYHVNNSGSTYYYVAFLRSVPTAVKLISVSASSYRPGALHLEWETGYEVDNLGFHVYREKGGERVRITPELIGGSALFAGGKTELTAGRSYSWWDILPEGTGQVQYWLEDVDLNGQRTWHGPVSPVGGREALEEPLQPAFLSEIGRARAESERALARVQEVRRRLAEERPRGIRPTGELLELTPMRAEHPSQRQKPTPTQQQVQWELAAGSAVKISVREEGWYRATQPELLEAGLDPSVNPRFLQLFVEGEEQPLLVSGESDRRFDAGDTIEFYGIGHDTPWTDTRTHWLVEGDRPGKRVGAAEGRARGKEAADSFLFTVECKERAIYFAALKNGDAENFFGPVISTEPANQLLGLPHLDPSPAGDALLEVALQGVTMQSHRVAVFLNDIELSELTFEGQTSGVVQVPVPQSELLEGDNLVTLAARGGQTDVSLIDFIRLTYWHTYTADDDALRFSALGGQQLTVGGFSNPQIRIVDITDAGEVREVIGVMKAESGAYAVTVKVPGSGQKTLLAFTEARVRKPVGISANQPSRWHQGIHEAELVIVSHRAFIESAELLKSLREGQGWKVALIDVEDLYDEFSFGTKSPYALRDFLVRAMNHWKNPPRFVLLIGDASFDPRNYLGFGDYDFVPTKLVETAFLETASDDWFADMDGDGLPEMAVGRLPVRSSEQAESVVWKILGYEQAEAGDWARNVLLVADKNDTFDFESASTEVRGLLPEDMKVQEIFRGQKGNAAARSELLERLNEGQLLVNYIGHGSVEIWRGSLLTSRDARGLVNIPRLPFVVSMTCLNGFFHDLYTECLAEALLKAEEGGAIAVWTSSGLTWPDGQVAMNKEVVKALFNGKALTIGEATLAAKAAIKDQDIRRTWILFGDPATRLK